MNMLDEQVYYFRSLAADVDGEFSMRSEVCNALKEAADTIEALSAKLAKANMERSEADYESDLISRSKLLKRIDSRIKDYRHDCNSGWQKFADCYEYEVRPLVRDFESAHSYAENEKQVE